MFTVGFRNVKLIDDLEEVIFGELMEVKNLIEVSLREAGERRNRRHYIFDK